MAPLSQFLVLAFSAVLSLQAVIEGRVVQISNIDGSPPIGVNTPGGPPTLVRVGGTMDKWEITETETPGLVFLRLVDSFPYITQKDNFLLATEAEEDKMVWALQYFEDRDVYAIEVPSDIIPSHVWTLDSNKVGSPVRIQVSEIYTDKNLWKLIDV